METRPRQVMDEQHCPLHKLRLQQGTAPILYGTFAPQRANVEAGGVSDHPFARPWVRGTCWVQDEPDAKVVFCPACREAWRATPAAGRLAAHLERQRRSPAREIAMLRDQQDQARRYKLILLSASIVLHAVPGAAISGFAAWMAADHLPSFAPALGAALGGMGGAAIAAFRTSRLP